MDMILRILWVKAITVSVRLRILFVCLKYTNKLSGTIAGETVVELTSNLP
jgi:hypothetical protein